MFNIYKTLFIGGEGLKFLSSMSVHTEKVDETVKKSSTITHELNQIVVIIGSRARSASY